MHEFTYIVHTLKCLYRSTTTKQRHGSDQPTMTRCATFTSCIGFTGKRRSILTSASPLGPQNGLGQGTLSSKTFQTKRPRLFKQEPSPQHQRHPQLYFVLLTTSDLYNLSSVITINSTSKYKGIFSFNYGCTLFEYA